MTRYAASTTVAADRSRHEIEKTLQRYGATSFSYGWEDQDGRRLAAVMFRCESRYIRFLLPMPDPNDREYTHTPARGTPRSAAQAEAEYEKATRQRWRALALVVKAKLEAVESDITTFEEEFMAHIVLPNGQTVGEAILPKVEQAYLAGKMPERLLLPGAPE